MGVTAKKKKLKKKMKGGEILSQMLATEGVEKIFGIIDGTYFGFYSTMGEHGIDLVTPRHETSAVHMAGAYARLTGRLGVCMASNGPGVANVLPGVAVENAEGNRVLLITSSRRVPIIYPDRGGTFQYFPQVDVIRPMAKWSCSVPSVDRMAEILRRALRMSYTGRPGVVHVDVPEDIMNTPVQPDPTWFREPAKYRMFAPLTPAPAQVDEAARMLTRAKYPLIHAGSGIIHAGAEAEVRRLAELLEAPLTTSWAARACQDERRPQAIPMIYIDAINKTRNDADLVLALGTRLGETDWWGKAPYWARPEQQELIQVDIDPEYLGNIRPADLPIQADVKVFLRLLIDRLERSPQSVSALSARRAHLGTLKDACRIRREQLDECLDDDCVPLHTARVLEACQSEFPDDAIMVVDGGNTAVWSNFYHEIRVPGTVVTTPKMGMLGAGVAQTLGAQVAHPDRCVYCVIGDGAMGFHMQEVETAVRNELPVIYLVLCDRQWGMVKMNQQFGLRPVKTLLLKSLGPDETINADLGEIEFDKLGEAMGAHGERVADPAELPGAIRRCLAAKRAAVIHVDVDRVKHMWAPNLKTFKEMHEEPRG
ncbi:MAG: thiamine pyrophosphate-binding protein [bacterium]